MGAGSKVSHLLARGDAPSSCIRTTAGNPVLTWDQRAQLYSLRSKDRLLTSVTRVLPKSNLLSHVLFDDKLIGLVPSRQNFLLKETPIDHPRYLWDPCPIYILVEFIEDSMVRSWISSSLSTVYLLNFYPAQQSRP